MTDDSIKRIAHYKSQPNFVPLAGVEDGQLYWFGVVKSSGDIRQLPGVVLTINGNKVAISHANVHWLDDERIFGAFRQPAYAQRKGIARMYSFLGNHEKATQIQLEAFYALTPEQHAARFRALQRAYA